MISTAPEPTSDRSAPHTEALTRPRTLAAIAAAGIGGAVFTLLCWLVLNQISLPAFNTSMVTRALATAGTVTVLVAVGALTLWWLLDDREGGRRQAPRWRVVLTYLVSYLSPAALVVTSTAIPLSATRLYLDGLQVDQGFRTQFLTRMATTWTNQDMNYIDMPTYYPLGWFWLGGRLADVLGIPGWEVYQPWALVSIATVACLLVPVWQRLTGSLPLATGIALVSVCLVLVLSPEEPYGAIIALGAPAATVLARRALLGSWYASAGLALFLGVSATMYTLFTGAIALAVVVIAVVLALLHARSWTPIIHLVAVGVGAILIALMSWGPYLWAVLTGAPHSGATAPHYLPGEGAELPVPFLAPSIIGLLCLIGLVHLIVRHRHPDIRALATATIVFYGWAIASMIAPLAGTTLLGFRVEALIVLQLATAGVLAFGQLHRSRLRQLYPERMTPQAARLLSIVMVVVLTGGGVKYAQEIPARNEIGIDHAYSDTDGYGERADRFVGDVSRHYADIDAEIRSHGWEPADTVVLTDESNFMSFYPYFGFQAFTSHYANPLGEFDDRNEVIGQWARDSWDELAQPAEFAAALAEVPWRAPDVFVFRGEIDDVDTGWKTHIAEDIFPNQPNVRFHGLFFNPEPFLEAPQMWHIAQVGPFVVVSRDKP